MSENTELVYGSNKFVTVKSDEGNLVNIYVEPLWKNRLDLWFQKIEAKLSICNIYEDNMKYNFLISLLDEETSLEVKDIINEPPRLDKYRFLKKQLMTRITAKNEEVAKKRMIVEKMGDRKPSEFYNDLNVLAGCYVHDTFVQEVWLECLPSKIRSVVECLKEYELDTITTVADRVHTVFFSPPKEQPTNTSTLIETLVKEVETLNKKVQMLKRGPTREQSGGMEPVKETQREKQCNPQSKHEKNSTNPTTQCKPCPYHNKYGVKLCKMSKNSH